jgi:hypothetical protein
MALAACGAIGINVGQRSAQDLAVQQSDVNGLTRCRESGPPESVAQALSSGGDDVGARRFASSWKDAKANGGHNAYVVGYAASRGDCLQYIFGSADASGLQGNWLLNYVILFSNDAQAQAAWNTGIYDGSTPDKFRSFGGTVGNGTGLGGNSATITSRGHWLATWSKGSSYAVFLTNYGPLTAKQLADKVAGRM